MFHNSSILSWLVTGVLCALCAEASTPRPTDRIFISQNPCPFLRLNLGVSLELCLCDCDNCLAGRRVRGGAQPM
ncbi:hypothetical protein BJX65DRAFT_277699 [Aspergillus insuetus]